MRDVEHIAGLKGLRSERTTRWTSRSAATGAARPTCASCLDGAADATRRYYNQLSEAQQKFNPIPDLRPHDVRHVGDDRTYGGTGAFWTRGRAQLVAFSADRIARVTVYVPGAERRAPQGRGGAAGEADLRAGPGGAGRLVTPSVEFLSVGRRRSTLGARSAVVQAPGGR